MNTVTSCLTAGMDLALATRIEALIHRTWPGDPPVDPETSARRILEEAARYDGPDDLAPLTLVIRGGDHLQAVAYTFAREIGTESGDMTILALAGVVVDEACRSAGLGRTIVRAAFERVDSGAFPFSLFQTAPHNRGFYAKLGSAFVDNRIVNSRAPQGPDTPGFWDELAVVYPDKPGWPEGVIDLRGPGY